MAPNSASPPVLHVSKGSCHAPWTYNSVQAAVDAAADLNKQYDAPITIEISEGTYKEQVVVPSKSGPLILKGAKGHEPKITFDAFTGKKITDPRFIKDGKDIYGTYTSASFAIGAADFKAVNVIFENCAGPKCGGDSGLNQAVALRVSAERASFFNCTFLGWQDTLYAHKGTSFFSRCRVEGSVDFIFGGPNTKAYFSSCALHFRARGWLTAHQRDLAKFSDDNGAFVFDNCTITASSSVEPGSVYLGRPWGPDARVIFHQCCIPGSVNSAGWQAWNSETDLKRPTYIECDCTGPGAIVDKASSRCMGRKGFPKEMAQFVPVTNFFKGCGSFPSVSPLSAL